MLAVAVQPLKRGVRYPLHSYMQVSAEVTPPLITRDVSPAPLMNQGDQASQLKRKVSGSMSTAQRGPKLPQDTSFTRAVGGSWADVVVGGIGSQSSVKRARTAKPPPKPTTATEVRSCPQQQRQQMQQVQSGGRGPQQLSGAVTAPHQQLKSATSDARGPPQSASAAESAPHPQMTTTARKNRNARRRKMRNEWKREAQMTEPQLTPEITSVRSVEVAGGDDVLRISIPSEEVHVSDVNPQCHCEVEGNSTTTVLPPGEPQQSPPLDAVQMNPECEVAGNSTNTVETPGEPQQSPTAGVVPVKHVQECPACGYRTRRLREHVMRRHLPICFRRCVDPAFRQLRVETLRLLARILLGDSATPVELADMLAQSGVVNERVMIPNNDPLVDEMRAINEVLGCSTPPVVRLSPVNTAGALLHWRLLAHLLVRLTPQQQMNFRFFPRELVHQPMEVDSVASATASSELASGEQVVLSRPTLSGGLTSDTAQSFSNDVQMSSGEAAANQYPVAPDSRVSESAAAVCNSTTVASTIHATVNLQGQQPLGGHGREPDSLHQADNLIGAIDSHCHLDRMGPRAVEDVERFIASDVSEVPVRLRGGVAVFCDPKTYPDDGLQLPPGWKMAVGIHPKKVCKITESQYSRFVALINRPCVHLGEIGVDFTDREENWGTQQVEFRRLISLSNIRLNQVMILHMRGKRGDPYGDLVGEWCREKMVECRGAIQALHLHCFTGTVRQVESWMSHFTRVYFGFTALVRTFDENQKQALRKVPLNRLLIETDSPHLAPGRHRVNSPAYIGEVASLVAAVRNTSVRDILFATHTNAGTLYGC